MSRRDPEVILRQMYDLSKEGVELARGRNKDDLENDRLFGLAMTHLVEIIGEASSRMPKEQREKWPQIDWEKIIGMRNRLIHGYDIVDLKILWDVIQKDLPVLLSDLEAILSNWPRQS